MTIERYIRIIAGTFVLVSLALGTWVNHNWYWFTAFVGANLFQSGITKWCLMEDMLRRFHLGESTRVSPVYNGVGVVKNFFHVAQTNLEFRELERGQGRPGEAGRLSKTLDAA